MRRDGGRPSQGSAPSSATSGPRMPPWRSSAVDVGLSRSPAEGSAAVGAMSSRWPSARVVPAIDRHTDDRRHIARPTCGPRGAARLSGR